MSHATPAGADLPASDDVPAAATPTAGIEAAAAPSRSVPPRRAPVRNPKRAVPILLAIFVFALVIDNGFKYMSLPISQDLGLDINTVSLQATLAGIIIGIGAVVYSTLADSVSIRRLLVASIILMAIGSLIGFAGQNSFPVVLTGRIVQTAGLAAAETLYVVYVTKYLSKRDQKTYLGFSTSAFQLSVFIGVVGSGFIATSIGWTALFLITLLALLALPGIIKYVPKEQQVGSRLDVFGLLLIAVFATSVMLFMQHFNWVWLLPVLGALALFVWHIRTHDDAIVTSEFFANKSYTLMLIVVFVLYSVSLGYTFILPFLMSDVHGYDVARTSLVIGPGYAVAAVVGALSGVIAKVLNSRQAITIAIAMITLALVVPAFLVETSVAVFVISMIVFVSGFALMYAPLLSTAVGDIPPEKSGVAIGFYNMTINIAVPIGIAYTAALAGSNVSFLSGPTGASGDSAGVYATILLILAAISALAFVLYQVFARILQRDGDRVERQVVEDATEL
ncbi:MFS transporter [Geodermatophilus sp. TF02-6]|uniref:MFS transporter n=1 Tax=Geodermatophilus sp. TF02-6 TaxID=2250575 RepID=UPI000DE852DF|nr:MFS transporter [Geodermatophilus sp. TF02-6]RBY81972.1 MFS transporter [Geodermatophilus sp. TF02-6]